jgi:membrane-bound lytic murein transglycosylase C
VVKDTYLYNAENNIELGVAYLHILYYRYLKRIKDPAARQWATIAAYNTGVQNVVKSFSGEYTKSKYASRWSWKRHAINKINKMKPEQVYEHLRNYLPYEETRDYIKKVRENIPKYIT